ncbi:MAG: hypothetical protein DMF23_05160 [Verrucomicrobia bacterium]|nr:MAG: hypothetical protein DMF23_05160 [Verrucomicrobiota bacterium]
MDCAVVYSESPPRRSILSRFTSHDSRSSLLPAASANAHFGVSAFSPPLAARHAYEFFDLRLSFLLRQDTI